MDALRIVLKLKTMVEFSSVTILSSEKGEILETLISQILNNYQTIFAIYST